MSIDTTGGVMRRLPDGAFGLHVIVDWTGGPDSPARVADEQFVALFASDLVDRIDMVAYGEPQTPRFAEHDPDAAGITLVQLIETSAITAHLVDRTGNGHLDVFSCRTFDVDAVLETVAHFFRPAAMTHQVVVRSAPQVP